MPTNLLEISTGRMTLALARRGRGLVVERFGMDGGSWLHAALPSGLFALHVDGARYTAAELEFVEVVPVEAEEGVTHRVYRFAGPGFGVDQHIKAYAGSGLLELWPVARAQGEKACRVTRLDSFSMAVAPAAYEVLHFTGDWGREFEPARTRLQDGLVLESRSGRSSKGNHPWCALFAPRGEVLSASVAWSGNWALRFGPLPGGGFELSGGLHDWGFFKDLQPGAVVEAPPVVLALGGVLDEVTQAFARVGRAHWYPRNRLSSRLPVEWNHWWPYRDIEIDEPTFEANVVAAAEQGMEVCTLDAGWFGPSDPGSDWYEYRGDWHLVNQRRFPSGIRHLSDFTHARGMSFGLWCEIEGLGVKARLALEHPDYVATRAGERLGYVCFGNPAVQEWAYQTLSRLIHDYNCDWIKLDFNLDPKAGCDREDHGHGAGDGLYEHYMGYYRTLERVRQTFPEVVLESCSSGGLRIDLGLLRRTSMTFLSDPDWPVHDLQIFWGASQMLAPDTLLHWSFCEWLGDNQPPQQNFNPRDPNLTRHQLDYYTRISMLGLYGLSQKLDQFPGWVEQRLAEHTALYKQTVRRFVGQADLFHLTSQPLRSGAGERWAAFQYSLPDRSEHLLFVFRLPGGEKERAIALVDLDSTRLYTIEDLEGEFKVQMTGESLMKSGILFYQLEEEDSALLRAY